MWQRQAQGSAGAEAALQCHQSRLQLGSGWQVSAGGHRGHLPASPWQKLPRKVVFSSSARSCLKSSPLGGTSVSHPPSLAVLTPPPLPLKQLFINHRDLPASDKGCRLRCLHVSVGKAQCEESEGPEPWRQVLCRGSFPKCSGLRSPPSRPTPRLQKRKMSSTCPR